MGKRVNANRRPTRGVIDKVFDTTDKLFDGFVYFKKRIADLRERGRISRPPTPLDLFQEESGPTYGREPFCLNPINLCPPPENAIKRTVKTLVRRAIDHVARVHEVQNEIDRQDQLWDDIVHGDYPGNTD